MAGKDNFCPVCGYDFHNSGNTSDSGHTRFDPFGGMNAPAYDPLGGVDKNADIDGQPANEVATLVAVNTVRYMPKFQAMKKTGKKVLSWNWAAFLIPGYWFFYRKCYIAGTITSALSVATTMLLFPFENKLSMLAEGQNLSYNSLAAFIYQHINEISSVFILLAVAAMLLTLIKSVVCGIFADYIYKRHCISTLESIAESEEENPYDDHRTTLMRKGGVSLFAPLIGYVVVYMLETLLLTLV